MSWIPFVCLGVGILLGRFIRTPSLTSLADRVTTGALVALMLAIGYGIGADETIIANLGRIGFNCLVICVAATGLSCVLTYLAEKTVLPLTQMDADLGERHLGLDAPEQTSGGVSLVWIMPASLIVGIGVGMLLRGRADSSFIELIFTGALVVLYVCVGIAQGAQNGLINYIKMLGLRVLWLPLAVTVGGLVGGWLAGLALNLPLATAVTAASGMSFYSLTGAVMTQSLGVEAGTYGFVVNTMREMFTVLALPWLIKISPGCPIACGGAGDMDTMLAPVTMFVGVRLGLVTLITGMVLTVVVPVLLPILTTLLH